ncbi:MAG TPA: 7-cyano-7-deazaguanine synthase [Candidatus Nitrosocosmicus sp.]|nr:7-cyano-7-deazaguanine synthase [Candidatus Nitrosocosmicus sp.]
MTDKSNSITDFSETVCIFSGGLDSVSTAAYMKKMGLKINLISFDYGQRGSNELIVAKRLSKSLKCSRYEIVNISFLKSLLGKTNILTSSSNSKIPSTFDYSMMVPLRNTVFLTLASIWATSLDISLVVYGAHSGDTRYADCRPSFTRSLEKVLNLSEIDGIATGLRKKLHIWSPAISKLSKSELLLIGYETLGNKIFETWSCYLSENNNTKSTKSDNLKQCGLCESCINRKQAFVKAGIEDKTQYVNN